MKKKGCIIFIVLICCFTAHSQKFLWKAGVHSFFDNYEFAGSAVQESQTMAGVHLVPQIGLGLNEIHHVFAGADVMREFGSKNVLDYYDPIIYYEYNNEPFRFLMGAFSRADVLKDYPKMFFQDSILNYRPVMTGIFWEYRKKGNYLNMWLDWTGRQTEEQHEAFFLGWSGRYNRGIFYVQHFGYMYHFAALKNPPVPEGLHDNIPLLTSVGFDLASKTGFDKLGMNVGWSVGLERDRSIGSWHSPQGLLSEINVEYRGLGLLNTLYLGKKQQVFYADHGNQLYWGNLDYRAGDFNRTDFYVQFFKSDVVDLKLTCSFHFMEKKVFNQESFYATFNLDNFSKKTDKKHKYLWDDWFRKEN